MKIRLGFVTNSSSSSYIIGYNGDKTKEEIKDLLLEFFEVPKSSPLRSMVEDVAKEFVIGDIFETVDEYLKDITECDSWEEYIEEGYSSTETEVLRKIRDRGMKVLSGFATNEDEPVSYFICEYIEMNIDTPDIVIWKEAGY